MLYEYKGWRPVIHESAYLAPGSRIIGNVEIGESSSVWFNAVLRGDLAPIRIGARANIQDGCIGHVNDDQPLWIGDDVSVGHGAIIHGTIVGRGSLIAMGVTLLNGTEIGEYSLIGAGSLVTENTNIPPYTLALGTPAKVIRELTDSDLLRMKRTTESYIQKAKEYKEGNIREIQ